MTPPPPQEELSRKEPSQKVGATSANDPANPRRVALIHDWLTGMRGGEKVLEAMADLFPDAPIFTLFHFPGSVSEALESHPIHTSFLQRAPGLRRHYRRFLPFFPAAVEDLDLAGYDLVLSSSHCVAKGVVAPPGSQHVCYCHTPMRYAWDQERAYFPRRRGLTARLRGQILSRLRNWDVGSSQRVDRFIANSSFVAERIRRYYRRQAEVLPPPVDVGFFTPGEGRQGTDRDDDYALVVSALAPYKRVDLAIQACEARGLELRVVGNGPERQRLQSLSKGGTRFLGRVDDQQLRELYRGARFFLQPGIEDFGIAAVEALACGTPVVAVGRGGVLDIVDSGVHGVLYEEWDSIDSIQQAIDMAREIRFNILDLRQRAESFSTSRFTERLRQYLGVGSPPTTPRRQAPAGLGNRHP